MEFLDISSLVVAYRYAYKIMQKLKKKTQKFGSTNPSHQKMGKGGPNPQNKGKRKDGQPQDNQSKRKTKKDNGKTKKDTGKWCEFHKSPWNNTIECFSKKSLVAEVKAFETYVGSDSEFEPKKGIWIIDA
jgi:hypothetical protein